MPKAAQESAIARLGLLLRKPLLAVEPAKGLLATSQDLARAERGLSGASPGLLPKLPEPRKGLAELGACAVELAWSSWP